MAQLAERHRLVSLPRLPKPYSWPAAIAPQLLEARLLFSVTVDAGGDTVIAPTGDDRVIYVSSSTGNDADDGSSAARPVRTLARGAALLRDGHGDELLLRRGDIWQGGLPGWHKSGESANNPMVIGAYGVGDRPTIATNGDAGFVSAGNAAPVNHFVLQGIRFAATTRDPASADFNSGDVHRSGIGIQFFSGGTDILIEDCAVEHYVTNIALQDGFGAISNVRLRKNLILDAYSDGSIHSEGFYAQGVHGLLLEGNVLDHNGWNETVTGAGATIFNHDAYLTADTTGVVVTGNIFSNASSHGLQARSGGDIEDNLFIDDPLGMTYGLVRGDGSPTAGGVNGLINGNVFLGTRDIAGQVRGVGIEIANVKAADVPTLLSNNIFSNVAGNGVTWHSGGFAAISLEVGSGEKDSQLAVGINRLTIQGNVIYSWAQGLTLQSGMQPGAAGTNGYHALVVKQNQFSDILTGPVISHPATVDAADERWSQNQFDLATSTGQMRSVQSWAGSTDGDNRSVIRYTAAGRSLDSYMAASGGGNANAFFAGARAMNASSSEDRFSAASVIDYVRGGYEDPSAASPRSWKPPTPPTAVAALPAVVTTDESFLAFSVTYTDDTAIDQSTIDSNDVRVTGRGGRRFAAMLIDVQASSDGKSVVATYSITSPKAVWRGGDAGTYSVMMVAGQVTDTDGFPVDPGQIGTGRLTVTVLPPPPRVRKVKFSRGKKDLPDSLTISFSADVTLPASGGGLILTPQAQSGDSSTPPPLDLSGAQSIYDAAHHSITWTFPALPSGELPSGRYRVQLVAAAVLTATADGKLLDGNGDGLGGDNFVWKTVLKVRRWDR